MKTRLRGWSVPIALLILSVLSFGILIPWLGFYWDDWPVILTGNLQGTAGYWAFYQYDRPISAWTYALTFPLLGSTPLHWHIFTLLLRWGTAAAFWWTLSRLWPAHRRQAAWAALLFSIYPVFSQQSIAVAYSQHWICYLLFFLSLAAMVEAWRSQRGHPARFWLLTTLAMAASLLQLLTMEYFAGLELLRPFLLWVLVAERTAGLRARVTTVLRGWLPYLLVLAGFTAWRLFFLEFPGEEANPPSLLFRMFAEPLDAGLRFLEIALQDILHLLVGVWANTITPGIIALSDRFALFSLGWTILLAAAVIFYLSRSPSTSPDTPAPDPGWVRQALVIGAAAIILGMLPVWFTDRQIIVGAYSNRFGLAAIPGASLVLVALLETVIARPGQRIFLVGLLIGLAAGAHVRTANDYRWVNVLQNRFFWQLAWRAPGIDPDTAIMAEAEVLPRTGLYSTAAAVNLIYAQPSSSDRLPYWFYSLSREFRHRMPELAGGIPLQTDFRHFSFEGQSSHSLVVFFQPSNADCLRILTPADTSDPALSEVVTQALPVIDLSRIQTDPRQTDPPAETIFGPEPEHGWCYLFQKADLARQTGDWAQVSALGDQAQELGYNMQNSQSNTPQEWIPFIEGYARVGRWQEAVELTRAALELEPKMTARACDLWKDIQTAEPQAKAQETVQELINASGCAP